jgi:hypothetical protein
MLLSPAVREEKTFTMKIPFSKILIGLCLGGVSLARADDCEPGTVDCGHVRRNLKTKTTRRLAGLSVMAQENGPVLEKLKNFFWQ